MGQQGRGARPGPPERPQGHRQAEQAAEHGQVQVRAGSVRRLTRRRARCQPAAPADRCPHHQGHRPRPDSTSIAATAAATADQSGAHPGRRGGPTGEAGPGRDSCRRKARASTTVTSPRRRSRPGAWRRRTRRPGHAGRPSTIEIGQVGAREQERGPVGQEHRQVQGARSPRCAGCRAATTSTGVRKATAVSRLRTAVTTATSDRRHDEQREAAAGQRGPRGRHRRRRARRPGPPGRAGGARPPARRAASPGGRPRRRRRGRAPPPPRWPAGRPPVPPTGRGEERGPAVPAVVQAPPSRPAEPARSRGRQDRRASTAARAPSMSGQAKLVAPPGEAGGQHPLAGQEQLPGHPGAKRHLERRAGARGGAPGGGGPSPGPG